MDPFALVHDGALLVFAGVWLGSAMWVYNDARVRLSRPERAAHLLAAAVVVPVAPAALYAFVRPAESPAERRARELSRRLLEAEVDPGERCLVCRTPVEARFLRCPSCATELRRPCPDCGEPLALHWRACPHCARELTPGAPSLRLVA